MEPIIRSQNGSNLRALLLMKTLPNKSDLRFRPLCSTLLHKLAFDQKDTNKLLYDWGEQYLQRFQILPIDCRHV